MDLIVLGLGFGPMLVTAVCLYQWVVAPRLDKMPQAKALQALTWIHCFRFISPISLVAGVTTPGLSTKFTYPQVVGDMGTALFALVAISMLRSGSRLTMPWLWFVNLFGLLDLSLIAVQGLRLDFASHVGAMYYVVVWFVPFLLVSHGATLLRLLGVAHPELAQAD